MKHRRHIDKKKRFLCQLLVRICAVNTKFYMNFDEFYTMILLELWTINHKVEKFTEQWIKIHLHFF